MIPAADYEFFRELLQKRSGLALSGEKQYLLESRLLPVARRAGLAGIPEIAARLRQGGAQALEDAVVEAMTTNESFFFRDKTPFEAFVQVMLPTIAAARPAGQPIRVWCAAASTGQEPFSLAMALRENPRAAAGRRVEIIATDLSSDVLARARSGLYSQFEVQRGLPIQLLVKYFSKQDDHWLISSDIRSMVEFRKLNLLSSFAGLGRLDIVFCRNVLIYFGPKTKVDVLGRIAGVLAPDGYLVLGAAETVMGVSDVFRPVAERRGLYAVNLPALA
jgi:chemotaxis protein methyltransferase CheR